jgi:hypothetical protein
VGGWVGGGRARILYVTTWNIRADNSHLFTIFQDLKNTGARLWYSALFYPLMDREANSTLTSIKHNDWHISALAGR